MSEYIITDKQLGLIQDFATVCVEGEKLPRIVRCRDCKHYMDYEHEYEPNLGYCREHDREEVRDSGFCAWAERRES